MIGRLMVVALAASTLAGCGLAYDPQPGSELVAGQALTRRLLDMPRPRVTGSAIQERALQDVFPSMSLRFEREIEMTYDFAEADVARFDGRAHLGRVVAQIRAEARAEGLQLTSARRTGDVVRFAYEDGDRSGTIEVTGAWITPERFRVDAVIHEKRPNLWGWMDSFLDG